MVDTEIWLRLMSISSLYGDDMVRIAHWLAKQSHIDAVVLQQTGLTLRQAQRFLSFPRKSIESSLCWLEQPNHHLIPADSEFYPPQLLATTDYPGALFVEGELHALHSFQLAVVGSRAHSWYGERWGRLFCETLATRGVTITSGLARGIDGVAHKAALQVNGVSIAVLGNGLNTIHPRRHAPLAASLLEQGGALVSEFPLDVPPLAYNFPRRNRIISGLSKGVLVVEAALRSGSLVTARCALDQARDIISRYYQRGVQLCSPDDVRRCVMVELAPLEHEEFGIILLDNQNQLLHREILFRGTLNSVSVHPREVIKRVLKHNAAAVILVHNHPSGEPEPSRCDIQLTKKLQELLEILDVRLLDHFIVAGTETVSMAERGLV